MNSRSVLPLSLLMAALTTITSCAALAGDVVNVFAGRCEHGILSQERSDFAVFVFCDDALGTQIGVIYQKRGVGPVERGSEWSNVNRFWQEGTWMIDVRQVVWSTSGAFLYVVTSKAYGDNSLYELDLRKRNARKLFDGTSDALPLSIELGGPNQIVVRGRSFDMKK